MILVTGATGTIGSEVVRHLAQRGTHVRAMTRDPVRAAVPAGADVVPGDFERPDSLRNALKDVESVFLLTAPGGWIADHDRAMIEAAQTAGVTKVVKLSAIGTRLPDDNDEGQGNWHGPGERALLDSGLTWTVLRPSIYASNALRWADAVKAGNPIPNMTGSGAQGVVDPRDVAAVAVEALTSDQHDGQTYTLTGPELLSVPDQAAQIAAELGHPVETIDVPLEAAREQMLAAGMHESVVEVAIGGFALVRTGGNAVLTDDLERILQRPGRSFRSWVHDRRDAFA